jgi:hypothetical protein
VKELHRRAGDRGRGVERGQGAGGLHTQGGGALDPAAAARGALAAHDGGDVYAVDELRDRRGEPVGPQDLAHGHEAWVLKALAQLRDGGERLTHLNPVL